jgi:type IV pilus assembly protein PilM
VQLKHKQSAIGIDMGPDGLKMIQFKAQSGGAALLAAASLSVPFPQNGNGDADAMVKELKRILTKRKFGSRRAVITLPASEVKVTPLTLPADKPDTDQLVRWEAESFLSYDLEDAIIDHVVLGEAKAAGERRLEVLASAVQKSKVLNVLDMLGKAGIITEAVDIAPLALCRFLHCVQNDADESVAAVDLGAKETHAVIMRNHELRMSRTIAIGGDDFTNAIAEALEISFDEAEILKCQHGTGQPDHGPGAPDAEPSAEEPAKIAHIINDILRNKLDVLGSELSKLLRYFSAQNQGQRVEKVYLVGGGGELKHLDELLSGHLETEVEVGAPITRLTGREPELKDGSEGAYAVAAGLALRGE